MKQFAKLRGKIVEQYESQKKFADELKVSDVTVISKLNGKSMFSMDDIVKWSNALHIEKEQVGDYFFADKL